MCMVVFVLNYSAISTIMSDVGEIEFLDEDADIVTQYVQAGEEPLPTVESTLLVERTEPKRKPKRKKEEDSDYEYDPSEDLHFRPKKKKHIPRPSFKRINTEVERKRKFVSKFDFIDRKTIEIRIPDYDDPLCLPVRALRRDDWDNKKLRNWNNLCLENYKQYDTPLRAEKQLTVTSKRSVVLRNMRNKITGRIDTTMNSKICVQNKNGDKKSEVIKSVLPKFREKKLLEDFTWSDEKRTKPFSQKTEVVLTKEVNKDVETLVVYKPQQKLSLVYKMFSEKSTRDDEEEETKYLKEIASCKICAPCYQASWRGFKKNNKKNVFCRICNRACISVYNLLAHLKCHSDNEVKAKKLAISLGLSSAVEYHYKCRICQEQCLSIKELRAHVNTHRGTEPFRCEIGNHETT